MRKNRPHKTKNRKGESKAQNHRRIRSARGADWYFMATAIAYLAKKQ